MFKISEKISPVDEAIVKGIFDGFGEILDHSKINKLTNEIKKLFFLIKQDSEGLSREVVYQMAFHVAKNKAKSLAQNKTEHKNVQEEPLPTPQEKKFPDLESIREINLDESPRETPDSTIKRAILDAFGDARELGKATTIEHINDEANLLYKRFIELSGKFNDPNELYQKTYDGALIKANEIINAYQTINIRETKKEEKTRKKQEAEQAALKRQTIAEEAKIELKEVLDKLLDNKSLTQANKSALLYFKSIYLDQKSDAETASLFPGSSRDQRYKWKERAVSMIVPLVSDTAKRYIGEKTKRKYASYDILLKTAHEFMSRCKGKNE